MSFLTKLSSMLPKIGGHSSGLKEGLGGQGPAYKGAGHGRRLGHWGAPQTGPNTPLTFDAEILRDRARDLSRNDPWGAAMTERRVTNMVGTGVKPRSEAPTEADRQQIQTVWNRWTEYADADGVLSFYGLEELLMREYCDVGEVLSRFRFRRPSDGLEVPMQLQLLEPEQMPTNYNAISPQGNPIRAGIERNFIGQRVRYWLYREHPAERFHWRTNSAEKTSVPADEMIHVYQPMRAGQLRGYPTVTPVLARLYEMSQMDDATVMRQWVGSLFTGFVTRPDASGSAINPLTGKPRDQEQDYDNTDMATMEAGTMQELPPGWDVEFATPPDVGNTYESFMRYHLMASANAVGMSYEILTQDLRGINDRLLRALLQEFRRRIRMTQHHVLIHQFCRAVWARWMDTAVLSGALVLPDYERRRQEYLAVRWVPERWPHLHPVQDVKAELDEVRGGLDSRGERVSERGRDIQDVDRENFQDLERERGYGLNYTTNLGGDSANQDTGGSQANQEPEDDTGSASEPAVGDGSADGNNQ